MLCFFEKRTYFQNPKKGSGRSGRLVRRAWTTLWRRAELTTDCFFGPGLRTDILKYSPEPSGQRITLQTRNRDTDPESWCQLIGFHKVVLAGLNAAKKVYTFDPTLNCSNFMSFWSLRKNLVSRNMYWSRSVDLSHLWVKIMYPWGMHISVVFRANCPP